MIKIYILGLHTTRNDNYAKKNPVPSAIADAEGLHVLHVDTSIIQLGRKSALVLFNMKE